MKVIVTGGAGFIGSHLVDRLLKDGHKPIVIDDLSMGKESNIHREAVFYKTDIRDRGALERVFAKEQPEVVLHHAAQTDVRRSMSDPNFDASVNILGSLNILDLAQKLGVRKIVFASTSAVYPEPNYLPADEMHPIKPISVYGLSKYTIEHFLYLYFETFNLQFTAFRYGNVYGPRQDPHGEAGVVAIFSQQMLSNIQPTIFGDGSKTRDYIHVDDIVSANMLVMSDLGSGEVFNLGWGEEVTDFQIFDAVRKALGARVEPLYAKKRPGELDRISLDITKAKTKLGWTPMIRLEEGIPSTVGYYRSVFGANSKTSVPSSTPKG